jgi:iron(III) transport system permease protein
MSDVATATVADHGPKRGIDWFPYVVAILSGIILVVFLAYPIGKTTLYSFVLLDDDLTFGNLTLDNFRNFIEVPLYTDALQNSITIAAWTTVATVVLALPAAYAVARIDIPYRTFLLTFSIIPLIAPPFIGAYSWIILFGNQGMIRRYFDILFGIDLPTIYGPFGIVLALSLHYFPFVFLFTQGALAASDPFIEESASIMGAKRFRIMRSITFPLVIPAIGAGAVLVFVRTLGNFGVPAVLGKEYMVLTTLMVYQVNGYFNLNAASAIALANVALTLIAVFFLARIQRRRRFITVTSTTRAAKRQTGRGAKIAGNTYVWSLFILAVMPQIIVLFYSFAERWAGSLWPQRMGWGNYHHVLTELTEPIFNSIYLAGGATLLAVFFGTLAAYISQRKKFFGKWLLDMTIMLPFIMPGIITGVAFLTTFNTGILVLTGTASIIMLAYFVRRLAYIFRAVSAAISQVDNKIDEASTICGAAWGYTMRRVTIPLVAPGMLAGGILVFSTLIIELSITIMVYSADWQTMSVLMFEQLLDDQIEYATATGSIAIILTISLVFAASRLVGKSMADMFR